LNLLEFGFPLQQRRGGEVGDSPKIRLSFIVCRRRANLQRDPKNCLIDFTACVTKGINTPICGSLRRQQCLLSGLRVIGHPTSYRITSRTEQLGEVVLMIFAPMLAEFSMRG
jgi:hypothetical protein